MRSWATKVLGILAAGISVLRGWVVVIGVCMAMLWFVRDASGARLGFQGPRGYVKPGETFVVDVVAVFEANEPAQWDAGARPNISFTVVWPECVRVMTCVWNSSEWQFSGTGWRDEDGGGSVWGRGVARVASVLTGVVKVASLECVAIGVDEDSFYYEMAGDPYETRLTVRQGGEVVDILGDPDDDEDGVDELTILVANVPGYILSVQPARRSIPLSLTPAQVSIRLRRAAEAAPYDHVRIHFVYDADTFVFVDPGAVRRSVPGYFTSVVIRCAASASGIGGIPGTVLETNASEGDVWVELWCAPTNAEGTICVFPLAPAETEEESELALGFEEAGKETAVSRLGVDLLGSVDDAEDGVENAWISVRYVDDLHVALRPAALVGLVGEVQTAQVVVSKGIADAVVADSVHLRCALSSEVWASNRFRFTPAAGVSSGLCASLVVEALAGAGGQAFPTAWGDGLLTLDLRWTNRLLRMEGTEEVLGILEMVPRREGEGRFELLDASVMLGLSELVDEEAQVAAWPVRISVAGNAADARGVMVVPEAVGGGVYPGQTWETRVYAYGGSFTNATYELYWTYDATLAQLEGGSGVLSTQLVMSSSVTAQAVRVSGVVTTGGTTLLSRVTFRARRPGLFELVPVMGGAGAVVSRMYAEGRDILGAASVADDGVAGMSMRIRQPERVDLVLEPAATLYCGGDATLVARVVNPHGMAWNRARLSVLLDAESFLVTTCAWSEVVAGSGVENLVETVYDVRHGRTTCWYRATVAIELPVVTSSLAIARLPVTILDEELFWMIDTTERAGMAASHVAYDDLELTWRDCLNVEDSQAWVVYPHSVSIWLSDAPEPPVLGSNYTLTVRVNNPHGLPVERVTFCWHFDAMQLEASGVRLAHGWTTNRGGFVAIDNYREDESYIAGDVRLAQVTTARDFPVASFEIRPKVNEVLEIVPGERDEGSATDARMGVWHPVGFNLLDLGVGMGEEACPVWRRGVAWVDVPQLVFEVVELEPYESVVLTYDDVFYNGDDGRNYAWVIEGSQEHVSVMALPQARCLVVRSLDAWVGEARFVVYCQRVGSPYVGRATLRVIVGDAGPSGRVRLEMSKTEFLVDKGRVFERARFAVVDAVTGVWVSAWIEDAQRVRQVVKVRDEATGREGEAVYIQNAGRVVVPTSALKVGRYVGRVEARYGSPTNSVVASATFRMEVFVPGRDADGDSFYLVYRGAAGLRAYTERVIDIRGGSDDDVLVMRVTRGPDGDGYVALESITSDHGLKQVRLFGGCGVIDVDGPLGTVRVEGGIVGDVIVRRGGLKALLVKNRWGGKDEEFLAEVGIAGGVDVHGDIGTIAVFGGSIGASDAPATIISRCGSIRGVQTRAMVKSYADDGWRSTVVAGDEGANIYASIRAPRGGIGSVTAVGGVIGAPADDPLCTVRAAGDIGRVAARAVNCEGEAVGGSIFADMRAGGAIARISAAGGDITRSEILWPEDIGDEDVLPVSISAAAVGQVSVVAKAFAYDGMRDGYGGNLRAVITVSNTLGSVSVRGGNACVQISTEGRETAVGPVRVRAMSYKEWSDDTERTWRGGDVINSIISTTSASKYRSSRPEDYRGELRGLDVDGVVANTWIGFRGPESTTTFVYDRFTYKRLERTEIWETKGNRIYVRGDYSGAR